MIFNRNKTSIQNFDISSKKAGIIGCGGLGCNIIAHLAGAGIGELIICDFDKVSESNLNRQFLYSESNIGEYKAEAARNWIQKYSPETKVTVLNKKIESLFDMEAFHDCDILLLASDNNLPRILANEYCSKRKKPLVNGGINGFYGLAYLYVPGKTPCLECAGLTKDSTSLSSISSVAGTIGSLEASLAIKNLLGMDGEIAGHLLIYDNESITKLPLSRREDCEFC